LPALARRFLRPAPAEKRLVGDEQFLALAREVRAHGRTMLAHKRLWILWQCIGNVAPLAGSAAEVGTYQGGSAYFIAAAFAARLGHEVPFEVIDTFRGHPEGKLSEHDSAVHGDPAKFTETSYESVAEYLAGFERLTVHEGEFSAVAPGLPEQRYRLVHVDVDLYEPARECLRYFGARLVPGGIVVLDDYGAPACPGIRRAAEEYLAGNGFQAWDPMTRQLVLVKR
jgi:predicted O-methyltransferase YrrM